MSVLSSSLRLARRLTFSAFVALASVLAGDAHAQGTITVNALDLAKYAIIKGEYRFARQILEQLEKAFPTDVETQFLLGQVDSAEGNLQGAVDRYRAILKDHPD